MRGSFWKRHISVLWVHLFQHRSVGHRVGRTHHVNSPTAVWTIKIRHVYYMRRILLPGFMPNLGDHERLDLLPENKALYDFWLDTTRDRSYFQYVKECAAVCVRIFDRYADESFELVGHSTGCTVFLFRISTIPDLYTERIAKVTLLCSFIFPTDLFQSTLRLQRTVSLQPSFHG